MKSSSGLFLVLAGLAAALPQRSGHGVAARGKEVAAAQEVQIREEQLRPRPLKKRANQLIPVVVGGQQVTFVPDMVIASIGDVIQFQFSNGNHTVTQSTETAPCTPLQMTDPTAVHSGHIPFQDGQTTVGTFNMVVTKTDPMFFYCATGPHCQLGQVMVINPSNTQQLVNYNKISTQAAKNVDGLQASGGSVGTIPLANAAFVPAPAKNKSTSAGKAGAAAPAASAAAPAPVVAPIEASPAPAAPAAPAEPAPAPPAEPAPAPPAEAAPAAPAEAVPTP